MGPDQRQEQREELAKVRGTNKVLTDHASAPGVSGSSGRVVIMDGGSAFAFVTSK